MTENKKDTEEIVDLTAPKGDRIVAVDVGTMNIVLAPLRTDLVTLHTGLKEIVLLEEKSKLEDV